MTPESAARVLMDTVADVFLAEGELRPTVAVNGPFHRALVISHAECPDAAAWGQAAVALVGALLGATHAALATEAWTRGWDAGEFPVDDMRRGYLAERESDDPEVRTALVVCGVGRIGKPVTLVRTAERDDAGALVLAPSFDDATGMEGRVPDMLSAAIEHAHRLGLPPPPADDVPGIFAGLLAVLGARGVVALAVRP